MFSLYQFLWLWSAVYLLLVSIRARRISIELTLLLLFVLLELPLSICYSIEFNNNFPVVNVKSIVSICLFMEFLIVNDIVRKLTQIIYLLLAVIVFAYGDIWLKLYSVQYLVGLLLVSVFFLKYVYGLLMADYCSLRQDYKIFIGFGHLVFITAVFPVVLFINELVAYPKAEMAYYYLLDIANLILSIFVLIGVVLKCRKWIYTT